ncbi:hypothetical protein BCV70DRAFT_205547 [Testicularia cyperi]|uniref:Uncharacterized protein n=1 Tax=Testicularia cyperi TaxID=1882483 RepID=A0A317XRI7_9BASI|nr:hypothetical protein BCV70DRAFT_205547 [Testicularia cyperi]
MSTTNNAPRTSYDLGAQPGPNKYLLVRYLSPPDYPKEKVSELREISLVYKDRHTARKLVRRWARSQEPPVDPAGYELCLSEERLAAAVDPDRRVYTYGLKGDNKLVWVRRKVSLPDPATPSNLSDIVRQTQERLPKRRRTSSRLIFFSDDEESEEEALSAHPEYIKDWSDQELRRAESQCGS